MRSAFGKELWRSISGSLARFLAIAGIVALGCGFFAGLRMAGWDMRRAADRFYDGTHLYDLRVLSTLGLSDEQVELVATTPGVDQVMPGYAADVMATLNGERYAMRLMSFDVDAARASTASELGDVVQSDSGAYLNRIVLARGDWPQAADECVLSADRVMGTPIQVGDEVEVLYGTSDLDGVLEVRRFRVSGLVHSSAYVSSTTLGYTNLGSGLIQQYLFVSPEAFSGDLPYTELFVTVEGAAGELSGSDEYQELVDEVTARIEALPIAQSRLDEVRAIAQGELDDAAREYEEGRDEAYEQLDNAAAQLDDALAQLDDARAQIASGQAELDAGRAELEQGRASAREQLAAARARLEAPARQLDAAQDQIDASNRQLDDAQVQLDDNQAQLDDALAQLDAAQAELDANQAQVDAAREELEDGLEQLAQGEAEWAEQREGLEAAASQLGDIASAIDALSDLSQADDLPSEGELEGLRAQLEQAVSSARALIDSGLIDLESQEVQDQVEELLEQIGEDLSGIQIDPDAPIEDTIEQLRKVAPAILGRVSSAVGQAEAQIEDGIAQGDATIEDARAELADAQVRLDDAQAQIDEGQAQIDAGRAEAQGGQEQIDAGRRQVADGREKARQGAEQVARGRAELERGWAELATQEAQAYAQLDAAQAQLDEGAAQLDDARAQLAEGEREYEDGLDRYSSSLAEVEDRLADAAAQLAAAQGDIDSLELPDVYVLDRTKNAGVASYQADSERIDAIAQVFPLIFFLVAALVSLTTMTRMVEDERVEIGTHKALGFSTAQITSKYVWYAALAGVAGSVAGILVLSQVLPYVVQIAYSIIYNVPIPRFPLPINLPIAVMASALGVGVTLVATAAAAAATLMEVPASLMLPRAPAPGKRILLERMGAVWRRVSFSWKVTLRNLFRYKRRLVMTLIGIAGCTALLLTGLGLHDSIWDIIAIQYEGDDPITAYTVVVGTDDPSLLDAVERELGEGGASTFARIMTANVQVASDSHQLPMAVSCYIPDDPATFCELVSLRERVGGAQVPLDANSVVLTEKVATRLGVSPGDTIYLYEQDDIGNATGAGVPLTLTGVSENYVYHYLYVGADAWEAATGIEAWPDSVLADIPDNEAARAKVAATLADMDGVSTVVFNTEQIDSYRRSLRSVNMVVVVLVVAAAALVFIVLYNLTNIQLIERTREIASLKVLGFDRREVAAYVFRETLLLVVLGALIGLGLGVVMEGFVVVTAEVDVVMFGRAIHAPSFIASFALTIVFSVIVMATLLPKLRRIDMVESLKSVD